MNIYVGNLPYSISEKQLKEKFQEFGEVESAKIITDKETSRSKGFGFVVMNSDSQAQVAIDALAEWEMGGRKVKVNKARDKQGREIGV